MIQIHDRFSQLFRAQNGDPVGDGLARCLRSGQVPTGGQALDLGAGLGHSTTSLLRHAAFSRVVAVEVNDRLIPELHAQVRSHAFPGQGHPRAIEVVSGDAVSYLEARPLGQWDLVQGIHMVCQLDHERRNQFFSAAKNCLGREGRLLLDRHFGATDTGEQPRRCSGKVDVEGGQIERWFMSWPERDGDHQLIRNEYLLVSSEGVRTLDVKETRMAICSEDRAMDEAATVGLTPVWRSEHLAALARD